MLTEEENKKKRGIGVFSETKPVAISAIESEMSDDPEAAHDLLDVLDDILEASDELQSEQRSSKQTSIFHLSLLNKKAKRVSIVEKEY